MTKINGILAALLSISIRIIWGHPLLQTPQKIATKIWFDDDFLIQSNFLLSHASKTYLCFLYFFSNIFILSLAWELLSFISFDVTLFIAGVVVWWQFYMKTADMGMKLSLGQSCRRFFQRFLSPPWLVTRGLLKIFVGYQLRKMKTIFLVGWSELGKERRD